MIVRVTGGADAMVEEPDVLTRFHVETDVTDPGALSQALAELGTVEDDHAWISIDALRRAVEGQVSADWAEKFDGMCAYARSKGWVDDAGTSLRAHIERA